MRFSIIGNAFGVFALSFVLLCTLFIEHIYQQDPCVLCVLQRAAVSGVCLGLVGNLWQGVQARYYAFSLLWALFGLATSLRHMGLNVCKNQVEHPFFFLSHRLYFWSFLLFFITIIGLVLLLFWYDRDRNQCGSRILFRAAWLLTCLILGALTLSAFR